MRAPPDQRHVVLAGIAFMVGLLLASAVFTTSTRIASSRSRLPVSPIGSDRAPFAQGPTCA